VPLGKGIFCIIAIIAAKTVAMMPVIRFPAAAIAITRAGIIIKPAVIVVPPSMGIAVEAVRMEIPGIEEFPRHYHIPVPVWAVMAVPQLPVFLPAAAFIAVAAGARTAGNDNKKQINNHCGYDDTSHGFLPCMHGPVPVAQHGNPYTVPVNYENVNRFIKRGLSRAGRAVRQRISAMTRSIFPPLVKGRELAIIGESPVRYDQDGFFPAFRPPPAFPRR